MLEVLLALILTHLLMLPSCSLKPHTTQRQSTWKADPCCLIHLGGQTISKVTVPPQAILLPGLGS